jgi:hypothetical protein
MSPDQSPSPSFEATQPLRWAWVAGGVIMGAVLIGLFMFIVDPELQRPAVSGLIVSLTFVLVGVLVGYRSRGETIREAATAGIILMLIVVLIAAVLIGIPARPLVWLLGPFFGAMLALIGGYAGEMLQGTLSEAHEDRAVDWPWVFVSVVIGFSLSTYLVFIGRALFDMSPSEGLVVFGISFFVTGWIVGYFSPGVTMVEPAIAAGGLVALHSAFIVLWFEVGPPAQTLLVALAGGMLAALAGGWLGERMQAARRSIRRTES